MSQTNLWSQISVTEIKEFPVMYKTDEAKGQISSTLRLEGIDIIIFSLRNLHTATEISIVVDFKTPRC